MKAFLSLSKICSLGKFLQMKLHSSRYV